MNNFSGEQLNDADLFSWSLELCIIWLNRILFLKLLEGQLINYNNNIEFAFLNKEKISDFNELHELFFDVLAITIDNRTPSLLQKYKHIPYLNSSLFDISEIEKQTLTINDLKNRFKMPVFNLTVLKDKQGNRISGEKNTLNYLFEFLDSFDFSSDSSAKIQEQNKSIINASVLGLIFEKINGYKDGSLSLLPVLLQCICAVRRSELL